MFIRCSNEAEKKKRIVEHYGIPVSDANRVRKKYNKKRANYYYANTAKKWDDFRNYALVLDSGVLDSGVLGIDGCVAVLNSLIVNNQ